MARDEQWPVCPHCNAKAIGAEDGLGEDCKDVSCIECGETFSAWAECVTVYVTRAKMPETTERLKAIMAERLPST